MVKKLQIEKYRKLKNIDIDFSENVNIIAGTNGTCKSSILHLVSNSYKAPIAKRNPIMKLISQLNKLTNPKIESLTRGDKKTYKDPAKGVTGTLYTAYYSENKKLGFRRHNSDKNMRFAIKPKYGNKSGEKLPELPVIYLGLFRLFPYGEFLLDESLKKITGQLPDEMLKVLSDLYYEFTNFQIEFSRPQNMGGIKTRQEFDSTSPGIDSNTISAGEDNLLIILLALVSLQYYFKEHTDKKEGISSILLIDEFDASLHPAFQIKLLKKIKEYSKDYGIQVMFTTHSLTLLKRENIKDDKIKLIYLIDDSNKVRLMQDPDYYKIETQLNEIVGRDRGFANKIPIFTEDAEARLFLELIFEYMERKTQLDVKKFFYLVNATFSAETIKTLSNDDVLLKFTFRSIYILDGDQSKNDLNRHLICLPGKLSPEELAFNHSNSLSDGFWSDNYTILDHDGYNGKQLAKLRNEIDENASRLKTRQQERKSNKGKQREFNKKMFNNHSILWKSVLEDWINCNTKDIDSFIENLRIVFHKTAEFYGIQPERWDLSKR
ncbi:AAA family ATPase [uncultured Abiotrophia sp.]|uniref:AAA family ATPase n=1 Tax=uncultured Abiotrophia sp. TaxID=316094 RepID=UPI00260EAA8A|nr:AAA family ATPase [uncultured Abiotrophia sp.]